MSLPDSCFVCGGDAFDQHTPEYRRCIACGHETLLDTPPPTEMVNDPLTLAAIQRDSMLDRFQGRILARHLTPERRHGLLLDIGSGSGRFLHRQRGKFQRHCGLEVTPAAIDFSRRELGLQIETDITEVTGPIDLATAWHSLEHFPTAALCTLLHALREKISPHGCVIVSVPNGASLQYRAAGRRYAFFDVPAHRQQFTATSLLRLFRDHGFACTAQHVSWPYNAFGYTQALLNGVTRRHNHLYYRVKRGHASDSRRDDLVSFGLLPFAAAAGGALSLVDAVVPDRQGVLTCCFEPRP